jgi:hypothetical protein
VGRALGLPRTLFAASRLYLIGEPPMMMAPAMRCSRKGLVMLSKLLPNNESVVDRALRVIVGLVLLSLVVVGPQTLWGLVGLVPLATGILGSCPAYTLFGISTCRANHPKAGSPG